MNHFHFLNDRLELSDRFFKAETVHTLGFGLTGDSLPTSSA